MKHEIQLAIWEHARFTFTRSSGKGGQNVNKRSTRVQLFLSLSHLPLSDEKIALIRERLASRINEKDELLVQGSDTRSQFLNRQNCEERALRLIMEALIPTKSRKATRPTKTSKIKRKAQKILRSKTKDLRKRPTRED